MKEDENFREENREKTMGKARKFVNFFVFVFVSCNRGGYMWIF